ncbi:Gfo/Idh/MocA family oxidoreductase [Micromonospora echinaurantiaca]|uniref:Gfo/Idh/MocA family oxidoreductase n=1 Tax=Micromonospora TaxID=1873 RepID=UPI000D6F0F51|nr:Gfo/Idh/MocA family oxidoreductase [Micromonospora sp. S4605]PWU53657.1 thiazolinyl imide reductase [Micromonospora sp. S4605]
MTRPRAVVCGTGFGRVYLAGLAAPESPVELAGILARGSDRSAACARRWGVPLYRHPDELPGDVTVACVVVGSAITGGPGARLAQALMSRGIHVLQEHPLHADELAGCLRAARANRVGYRLNSHHVHVAPVRRFVAAARALLRRQPPLFVDAAGSVQVLYPLLDVLGAALGRLRPWGFAPPAPLPAAVRALTPLDVPFRSLDGVFAGVPTTLRVQHQMDPREPDNHAHLWHRITIGTEGGQLTLVSSTGPVLWTVRPHLPREAAGAAGFDRLGVDHLALAGTTPIGPPAAPSWAQTLDTLWPEAVRVAVRRLTDDVARGADPMTDGQYHLGLCQLTREITQLLGPVELVRRDEPRFLAAGDLIEGEHEVLT